MYRFFKLFFIFLSINLIGSIVHSMEVMQKPFASHIQLKNHKIVSTQEDDQYAISPEQIDYLKKQILTNSTNLLLKNCHAEDSYQNAIVDKKIGYLNGTRSGKAVTNLMNENIVKRHTENPLCFLNECVRQNCNLTRFIDWTKARKQFEDEVVDEIRHQLTQEKDTPCIVNVGSGELFQDLSIITKALETNKDLKKINVCLIDRWYKQYIKAMNNKDRWDHQDFDYLEDNLHRIHVRFAQLCLWFKYAYPQCEIQWYIFKSINEYLRYKNTNSELLANIYLGADLDKSMGTPKLRDYIKFLSEKPDTTKYKNGHEAYLSAPIKEIIKSHGIGLFLTKDYLEQDLYTINHCLKLLPAGVAKPDNSFLINPEQPQLADRYFILHKSYHSPLSSLQKTLYSRINWIKNNPIPTIFGISAIAAYYLYRNFYF